jgi:hypothetical protein
MPVLEFPNIKPQFLKKIQTPDYTLATVEAKSGYENTIRKGFQGYSTQLTLEYQHISEIDVITIINFYNQVKGSVISFKLPENFFNIQDIVTYSIVDLGSTGRWKFENEPTLALLVATPTRGCYNWQIQLKAVYPESTGSDDLISVTDPSAIATTSAPIVTPVAEVVAITSTDVIVIPITNVNNPVETATSNTGSSRLVRNSFKLTLTESIAVGASLSKNVNLSTMFNLLQVTCNQRIRLRLYTNSTSQALDLNRVASVLPTNNIGLVFEGIFTTSVTLINVSPVAIGYNIEGNSNIFPVTINNTGSTTISNFDINFSFFPLEV